MICRSPNFPGRSPVAKTTILLLSVVFFFALVGGVSAQKKFSKTYPTGQNIVKFALLNRSGTVTVEGWDRTDINITAVLESPAANIVPQNLSGVIVINLVKDNQGRPDVGIVNFTVRVPYYAQVDIETLIGNVNITNVSSGLVRAKITSEGDISLTNIGSSSVSAENTIGDIFFDGDIQDGGTYRFSSTRGTISLHIPFNASFRLTATAPSTRNISLGVFSNGMNIIGNGRRVIGTNGDGSAALSVTNQQGSILFFRR